MSGSYSRRAGLVPGSITSVQTPHRSISDMTGLDLRYFIVSASDHPKTVPRMHSQRQRKKIMTDSPPFSTASSAASAGATMPRSPTRGAHGRRLRAAWGESGRQRLHPDAQRHRLHRGGLCRDAARRLCGAGQLALQAGGNPLHPRDSGTRVLVGHADMLHQLRDAVPEGVTVLSVPTPPEILPNYRIAPDLLATPDFAVDLKSGSPEQSPYDGPGAAAAGKHDLHVRHHGPSQGRATPCADARTERLRRADAGPDLRPCSRRHGRCCRGRSIIRRRTRSACVPAAWAARWC